MTGSGSGDHDASRLGAISGEVDAPVPAGYVGVKAGLALAPVRIAIGSCTAVVLEDAGEATVAGDAAACDGNLLLASSKCCSRLERAFC